MFINIHTHNQLHDAKLELVNLPIENSERTSYYSYGIHPWFIKDNYEEQLDRLEEIAKEKRCLAIGECGLDKLCDVNFELQEKVFKAQVEIANRIQKPLLIHCVKSFNELINCLRFAKNKVPVIIHGYNNNSNIARIMDDEGYYFSFGKALLGFESNAARAIKSVSRKKFFLETDDQDLSIKYVYHKASELLGIDEEFVKQQIMSNFKEVFNIDPQTLK
ncbi:MAG: TatD family hydrolase [Bacteroidia bacterium]